MIESLSLEASVRRKDPCLSDRQNQLLVHLPIPAIQLKKPDSINTSFKLKKLKYLPKNNLRYRNYESWKHTNQILLPAIQSKNPDEGESEETRSQKSGRLPTFGVLKNSFKPAILNEIIGILKEDPDTKTNYTNTPKKIKTQISYENEFLSVNDRKDLHSSGARERRPNHLLRRNLFSVERQRAKYSFTVEKKEKDLGCKPMEITFYKPKREENEHSIRASLPELLEQNEFINF